MYEKKLIGRRPLYFRYAPPLTDLDAYTDDELPKPPFKGALAHQRSVYYYWWLFLKEHEGYLTCCKARGKGEYAELYADFGDVRDDDFVTWWRRGGRRLFCVQHLDRIYVHPNRGFKLDARNRVVVSLPVNRELDGVVAELKQILGSLQEGIRVRPPSKRAKYEVARKPVLSSLHQHWNIWRLRKQHPRKKLHEIADLAGIQVDTREGADAKAVKAITVSRYLKQAKTLIDFVGKGMFPITKAEQAVVLLKRKR